MEGRKDSMQKPLKVRRADLPRDWRLHALFGGFRFLLYGFLGLGSEVCFYTLVRVGRLIPVVSWFFKFQWHVDKDLGLDAVWNAKLIALFGQCSLWMFLVYAIASMGLVEPIYRLTARRWVGLRALLYGLAILLFEMLSGHVLKWLTTYEIWYYDDPLQLWRMTSLYILPIWMVTGLLVELIYRELMDPGVRKGLEEEIEDVEKKAEALMPR
jgi:hypothetical protein